MLANRKTNKTLNESVRRIRPLTTTEKNGQRARQAMTRWRKLLESKTMPAIKNHNTKQSVAMVLENQATYLNEKLIRESSPAMTTAMLGPDYGLHGGDLSNSDFYAPGNMTNPTTILPLVRRVYAALMANEVVGVQPMSGPVGLAYAIRYRYARGASNLGDSMTEHVHGRYQDSTSAQRDTFFDGYKNTEYTASGIRGVETKAQLDADLKLLLVVGNGFPKSINPFSKVETGYNGQKDDNDNTIPGNIVFVHPLLVQILGIPGNAANNPGQILKGKVYVKVAGDSLVLADLTATAGWEQKVPELQRGMHVVGISQPSVNNIHIDDAKFDQTTGKWNLGNSEMGFQRIDNRFTGQQDARLGQWLAGGRWKFRPEDTGIAAKVHSYEGTGAIAKTAFGFEKQAVEAGTRKLSTTWTLEVEEDLKNTNGIDISSEASSQMSYELQAEIDRELLVRMLFSSLDNGEWSIWTAQLADGRWGAERALMFYQHIIKMSIRMGVRNRRGNANFIVCTPDVMAMLQILQEFIPQENPVSVDMSNMQTAVTGTLGGRFKVYVDNRTPVYNNTDYGYGYDDMFDPEGEDFKMPNYCMLGFKGTEKSDAGIIYCPYIPIMVQTAIDPSNFSPNMGLMTRYGVVGHIFGSQLYYHTIVIDDFSNPGVPADVQHLYPNGYLTPGVAGADKPSYAFPVKQD